MGLFLYKAFIIDDDHSAIESISSSIDWAKLNVNDVVPIQNPHNVSERIREEKPDIVFIDIEMGDFSGLDIIRKTRGTTDAVFVVVSGHDDFKYAKEAIELNVAYYLLKPISPTEADLMTEKILDILCVSNRELAIDSEDISSYLTDRKKFEEHIQRSGVQFPGNYLCVVAHAESNIIEDLVLCMDKKLVSRHKIGVYKHLLIVNEDVFDERIKRMLHNIAQMKRARIGVSDNIASRDAIYAGFKQANILSYGCFIYQEWDVYSNTVCARVYINDLIDALTKQINDKKIEAVKQTLKATPEFFKTNNLNIKHAVLLHNAVSVKINSLNYAGKYNDYIPVFDADELINEYKNLTHMCERMEKLIEEFLNADLGINKDKDISKTFHKVLDYVDTHYTEKISLAKLSEQFHISISYLCALFKESTGKTFVDYLTELRMEKAKEMLKKPMVRSAAIAEKLGYSDYFYFNKLFKKYTGTTPYRYRKELERENSDNED